MRSTWLGGLRTRPLPSAGHARRRRRLASRWARVAALAGVVGSGLLACAPSSTAPPPTSGVDPALVERAPCVPHFPLEQGWLGGDAVYSVSIASLMPDPIRAAVSSRPTLWLFGDSFVAGSEAAGRRDSTFVHNSVGRSRCRADGRFEIDYAWGRGERGRPTAIFETGREDRYWWPLGGIVFEDALYVGLLRIAADGDSALGFEPIGVDLGRVANPADDPESWRVDVLPLSRGREAFPVGAIYAEGQHVFFYGFLRRGAQGHPRFLARLPLASLRSFSEGLGEEVETWGEEGRWLPGLQPGRAAILMEDDATEMSVAREPDGERLRAVYSFPYQSDGGGGDGLEEPPSPIVYTRTAERPEGPWSAPLSLFSIPDLREDSAGGFVPGVRCYAAKAHPGFGTIDRMIVTYVCNPMAVEGATASDSLQRLLDDPRVYRPKVVSWPRPIQSESD